MKKVITVALAGNPNSGKTTIFNQLTGARQKVGNWPGVTVEKKEGKFFFNDYEIHLIDLPGIYSLSAYSIEEIVARDFILERKPDVVVDIVDASNLDRNLYLTIQLIELGVKLVLSLNMIDVAENRGYHINHNKLGELLGTPAIPTIGTKGDGLKELLEEIVKVKEGKESKLRSIPVPLGREIEEEILKVQQKIEKNSRLSKKYSPRWLSVKLLENDKDIIEKIRYSQYGDKILEQVEKSRNHIMSIYNEDPETIITEQRYGFIDGAVKESTHWTKKDRITLTDKIDKVLMNRILGFPIFFLFIWLLFQGTFTLGGPPMEWIASLVNWLSHIVEIHMAESLLKDLIIKGVLGGVGGVLIFLPNILLLFLGISILEDTGYMARAAFIMDRVMHAIGLHGKSFIPLIMGFGCNVPAILATRTLENKRDRILTILINPLMSCSARLPVYVLFAGAFFKKNAGNVIFSIYMIGIILAIIMGQIFKKTLFKGESAPFVMELPPYRVPTIKSTFIHMWERGSIYLKKMGGIILVFSIIIWFLGAFPTNGGISFKYKDELKKIDKVYENKIEEAKKLKSQKSTQIIKNLIKEKEEKKKAIEKKIKLYQKEHSYIGRIGKAIVPIIKPLGFNWQMGVALVTGFVAKEVVVSTLGVLFQAEEESLKNALAKSGMTPLVAYAFMVFVLIYIPCLATVVAIYKESSIYWALFTVSYTLVLAWIVSFLVYRVGYLFL